MIKLAEYNNDPYNLDLANITTEELFNLLLEKKAKNFAKKTINTWLAARNHISSLNRAKYKSVKAFQMQSCIDNCGRSYSTQGHIKSLFAHLDKLALEFDIISVCYSQLITIDKTPETNKKPFTDNEVALLWENKDIKWVDCILFLLYTGLRPEEMIYLKKADIDINKKTIYVADSKTPNGIRYVSIH